MLRHPRFMVILALAGFLLMPLASFGDDDAAELQRQVDSLRSQIGVGSPDQKPAMRRPEGEKIGGEEEEEEEGQEMDDATVLRMLQPQSHVKVEGGIPFPKMEDVVLEIPPTPVFDSSAPGDPAYAAAMQTPFPEYQRPTRCESGATEKISLESKVDEKDEQIVVDSLYVSEDLVPIDPSEVFGSKTKLYPYGPVSGDGAYVRMRYDRVPCLPYRIRMSNRAVYFDSGNNALKNYDSKPSGKGVYHVWIQQKLFSSK